MKLENFNVVEMDYHEISETHGGFFNFLLAGFAFLGGYVIGKLWAAYDNDDIIIEP